LIIGCFTVSVFAFPQMGSAQIKPAMVDPAKAPITATGIDEVKITLYDAMGAFFASPLAPPMNNPQPTYLVQHLFYIWKP